MIGLSYVVNQKSTWYELDREFVWHPKIIISERALKPKKKRNTTSAPEKYVFLLQYHLANKTEFINWKHLKQFINQLWDFDLQILFFFCKIVVRMKNSSIPFMLISWQNWKELSLTWKGCWFQSCWTAVERRVKWNFASVKAQPCF